MSYKIRTCKMCGQKLHIRQKGKLIQIKNRCRHFDDKLISIDKLESMATKQNTVGEGILGVKTIPEYCITHGIQLQFIKHRIHNGELYHCKQCAIVHRNIPWQAIKRWKKESWTREWFPGDVKIIKL